MIVNELVGNTNIKAKYFVSLGLLARYDFDSNILLNSLSNLADLSGNGNHATIINGNSNYFKPDGSMEFGNSQRVNTINQSFFNGVGGSVASVLRYNTRNHTAGVIADVSNTSVVRLMFGYVNTPPLNFFNGFYATKHFQSSGTHYPDGYFHLCMTYDRSSIKVYVNGALIQNNAAGAFTVNNTVIHVGGAIGGAVFNGNIKNMMFYDRALSQDEVSQNQNEYERLEFL